MSSYTDPAPELATVSYVAQIMWNAFASRYGHGTGSLLLMLVPLGACFFCGLLSVTSASRWRSAQGALQHTGSGLTASELNGITGIL